ncbi:MAG: threonine synthase [Solirubrobacterales bacterium]|nr:threonine synthase [Solirubrobacterales bacterium]
MATSYLSHLQCSECGRTFDADRPQNLCACGSPLLARYDLTRLAGALSPAALADRPRTLWRYRELLPVRDDEHVTTLGEGMTPLVALPRLGERLDLSRLALKDEGIGPTGTFKARGAAVGVSRARELGIERVAMPTNGNAGAAWSVYAARAGLAALVVMPIDAPGVTRRECAVAGAQLSLVDGAIADAGAIVARAVADRGWFDVSTLKEPYRLEGKKTMGLELFEQLGARMPDVIIYPAGGGVGLIGIHKAMSELRELGWYDGPFPRLVAVQSAGCAPVVRAYEAGERRAAPWGDGETIAFGINVAKPLGAPLMLDAIYDTGGCAVAVPDPELLDAMHELARLEGAFVCPEGAATVAAARRLRETGWLQRDERVVLLNTGTGLKYPETVTADPPVLRPGDPVPDGH